MRRRKKKKSRIEGGWREKLLTREDPLAEKATKDSAHLVPIFRWYSTEFILSFSVVDIIG